jgi:hypothetical protein
MVRDRAHQRRERECPYASRATGDAHAFRTFSLQPDHQADADRDGEIEPWDRDQGSEPKDSAGKRMNRRRL